MTVTRSELQAWLDTWNENHAAPSADSVVDFLGIELAPEPTLPVGQRRRSPDGTEAIKTDDGIKDPWRRYVGSGGMWFTDAEVADWEVITDAPECDREHLPDGHVAVDLRGWPDATLRTALVSAADPVAAAARAELARPLSPLLLSEAATAGRRYDGAISVPDLAWAMQCTQTRARQITKAMVAAGRWVEKGASSTGARCYGEPS